MAAAVVAAGGLAIAGVRGVGAFTDRVGNSTVAFAAEAAKWECVADTVERLALPGDVLNVRDLDPSYVQPRVIESVYPQVSLVRSGGTATLVVEPAVPGAVGDRCAELVLRIER